MKSNHILIQILILLAFVNQTLAQGQKFPWPDGKKMALSLSFDDARASNTSLGIPLLDEYGIKATFFVIPASVKKDLNNWKKAVANGHEIGNHSIMHPCSGNFIWSRERALENYTLDKMRAELVQASAEIEKLLGVVPKVYAYPCGEKFVGKGIHTQSLVPLISEMFLAGRGWMDEAPSDPIYADLAQLTGMEMDQKEFEEILPLIESASKNGQWLVLAGHETDHSGNQTTRLSMLKKLAAYANDPSNGIWIAPIGTIAKYVNETRLAIADTMNIPQLVRPSVDGQLRLTAENGRGIGPAIQYMPEWKAFGWFTSNDSVVWEVDVPMDGNYEVWLDWSVSDEEAGKEFILTAGKEKLLGIVEKSGSWETFQKKSIGTIPLKKGYGKVIFKSNEAFEEDGAILDLRELTLIRKD
ncbi:Predicted xylanase/chitin deacetylase [Aquiflexum balticum DSM 16537]|uniref:Predicted xylanase/chitin deacetylase n=1 Tax=Aquiflexum balticum DSM 16537 TaxID=758820 RepID=A0A1W2GXW4_9BACT|nr:polysaccharide deacetylase family protein [Aquiflexum balticum]SMD41547.1 Predicted xylanase/chitin deacetylase [Aquiflexum balticum DSM 16537]